MIVKGKDLMIFKKDGSTYKALAHATNHTHSASREMKESSSKDTGSWGSSEPGRINWTINTENLFIENDYDTLMSAFISGERLTVAFSIASNATEGTIPSGGWLISEGGWEGEVLISQIDANAQNGENATYSATFTGVGEYKKRVTP